MIQKRTIIHWSAAALLTLSAVTATRACECGLPRPPLKALAMTTAVFSGEIVRLTPKTMVEPIDVETMAKGFTAEVKVFKSWKGDVKSTVLLHTGSGFGDCGIELEQGKSYLFYAYRGYQDGPWEVGLCTRTRLLKGAEDEMLELDGRQPEFKTDPQEPVLELRGRINDAGYHGYIFTLRNRLHERIFYANYTSFGHLVQARQLGRWVDYPPNYLDRPLHRYSPTAVQQKLNEWRQEYAKLEPERNLIFLGWLRSGVVFVPTPVQKGVWRVGFQYLSEKEVDAGEKIQQSKHYVWSAPVSATALAKSLSFEEAFEHDWVGEF